MLIWIILLTRISDNWGIESKSPFFMFIIPTRSWWINTKLILILDPLSSDPCVTSDKQTCICASPLSRFSICHVKPWRWRLLCHTRHQTWWWQYLLVSLAEVFCLTDLYLGIGSNQLNYGFATHDSVSITRNNHTWLKNSTFEVFSCPARLPSELKAPSRVPVRPVLVVTQETSIQFDELLQERRNSIAHALELRLSCTDPSTCGQSPSFVLDMRCVWDMLWCGRWRKIYETQLADRNKRYWRMFKPTTFVDMKS